MKMIKIKMIKIKIFLMKKVFIVISILIHKLIYNIPKTNKNLTPKAKYKQVSYKIHNKLKRLTTNKRKKINLNKLFK